MSKILYISQKADNAIGIVDKSIKEELGEMNHNFDFLELKRKGENKYEILYYYIINIIFLLYKSFSYDKLYFSWENPYVIFARFFYPWKYIYMNVCHVDDYWGKTFIGKLIFYSVDYYLTISNFTKNQLLEYKIKSEKIHVNYIGISSKFYPEKDKNFQKFKYILYVGTELERKNIKNLLFAFKEVINEFQEIKLIKIGRPVEGKEITDNLVKEIGLENHIIFIREFILDEDLRKYYSNALCYVSVATLEGFGMTIPEAMACGCPVVFSNIPPFKEIVLNNGIMVDPYNVEDIKNGIITLIGDDDLRLKLSKNALKRSKYFNWRKCANNLIKYFEKTNYVP